MAALHEVVGATVPLTISGTEWHADSCPFEASEGGFAVIGDKWRCYAHGCHEQHGDDALGFLRMTGLSEDEARHRLGNGYDFAPTLLKPTPPPPRYGLQRVADDPRPVLILDNRKAAEAAEAKLPKYQVVMLWGERRGSRERLEPLRGRNVLLWPSVDGLDTMRRLESVLADRDAINCKGKVVIPDGPAPWGGSQAELVAWAKARAKPIMVHAIDTDEGELAPQNPPQQVEPTGPSRAPSSPSTPSRAQAGPEAPPPPLPPAAGGPLAPYHGQDIGKPSGAIDWDQILERTKAGLINNLDNVVRVIENDPGIRGHIWYDEFLDSIVSDWQEPARRWRDSDDVLLQLYVQRHVGLTKIGVQSVHDAALVAAFRNVRNECREWLDALKWDGTERLAYILTEAFGAEQSTYAQAVGRCWFISMVARVMDPGCKVDTVPVLEGAQGVGKSSALRIIGGKWFAECHESVLTKDWYGVLDGHMLVEISEMHSFTRGEVERVKGLISCQVDRYRKSYGRNTEDHPRQSVLVCTTNRDDWQRDETGARRFWPVLCGAIDLAWLTTNRDNLFAEAVHLYRAGVTWWAVPEAEQLVQVEKRREADSWEMAISDWLKGRDRATTAEILSGCLSIELAQQEVIYQRRVARTMRALKWEQHVMKSGRTWVKPVLPA